MLLLHANTPIPDVFWRKWWLKRQDYLKMCHMSLIPHKEGQTKFKPDCVIQLNCGWVRTDPSFETTSNIGELQLLKNIKNASPFRRTMADYICSSSYLATLIQSKKEDWLFTDFLYYRKGKIWTNSKFRKTFGVLRLWLLL